MRIPDMQEEGCPDNCKICAEACPVNAISIEKKRVYIMRCLLHASKTPFLSKLHLGILRKYKPDAAERLMNLKTHDEHTMQICSRCISACPYGE
jgi:ferredoxin